MRLASAITTSPDAVRAVEELLELIEARVTPGTVDLAMLFVTAHFARSLPGSVDRLNTAFPGAVLMGCTAEGTIGCYKEVERKPSMSLLTASLPGVRVRPFHARQPDLEAAETTLDWERIVGAAPESPPKRRWIGNASSGRRRRAGRSSLPLPIRSASRSTTS
jgi:small ligand-binding sensory domain FIST